VKEKIDVVKVLVEDNGKFLVLRKSEDYDWKAGKWELPGGSLREFENIFEAARREVKEETGLEIQDLRRVVRTKIEEIDNEKPVVDCWILFTKNFTGEIELSEEHGESRWVKAEEFLEMNWHRDAGYNIPSMKFLEDYLEKNTF
jgi:8-oxo-dGTP diphosphatase